MNVYEFIVQRLVSFGRNEIYVRNDVLQWSEQERIDYMHNLIALGFYINQ